MPHSGGKYFNCHRISPYSQEQEILMGFGGYGGVVHFQNIKSGMGENFIHYIPMIRMIEQIGRW